MSQPWAGRNWGAQTIPRVGMEVLIAYVEGDPDKPMVVGVVPNTDQMPPLSLPANRTRTSLKTASSPGGAGFNELSFEDQAGAEEVFLHAQKDASEIVNSNKLLTVGNAYTAAAQTLHMTTVQASQTMMTPADIVLQHLGSMIRMDASGITISFGSGHAIQLSDAGVQIRSTAKVQAVQGEAANFVSIDGDGVYTKGKTVTQDAAGEGAHQIHMSADGVSIHSDATVQAWQADDNFVSIDKRGRRQRRPKQHQEAGRRLDPGDERRRHLAEGPPDPAELTDRSKREDQMVFGGAKISAPAMAAAHGMKDSHAPPGHQQVRCGRVMAQAARPRPPTGAAIPAGSDDRAGGARAAARPPIWLPFPDGAARPDLPGSPDCRRCRERRCRGWHCRKCRPRPRRRRWPSRPARRRPGPPPKGPSGVARPVGRSGSRDDGSADRIGTRRAGPRAAVRPTPTGGRPTRPHDPLDEVDAAAPAGPRRPAGRRRRSSHRPTRRGLRIPACP